MLRVREGSRRPHLLPGSDWVYLAALLLPTGFISLMAALMTLQEQYRPPTTWWQTFLQIYPDACWLAGMALACVLLFSLIRRGWPRLVLLVLTHAIVLVHCLFTLAAYTYHSQTGSLVEAGTVTYALGKLSSIGGVLASELTVSQGVWVLLLVLYIVAGPVTITNVVRPREEARSRFNSRKAVRRACFAACLALTTLAAEPFMVTSNPYAVPRAMAVLSGVASGWRSDPAPLVEPTAENASLAPTKDSRTPNVVVIAMESVGHRATSLGKQYETTPNLAKLAKKSIVAEQAYPVVPHTSKSLTGLNCGIEPDLTTRLSESTGDGPQSRCLAQLLGDQGYQSAFFQSAVGGFENRADLVKRFGYDEFHPVDDLPKDGFARANYFGWEDDIMLGPSNDWISAHSDKPFLLSYLTVTAHHDYKVPAGFESEQMSEDPEFNAYLNTVRYTDRFVGKVLDQLEEQGVADNTIVVVTGDHGEGFGEHGLSQHDNTIYEEGIHIPLLVYDPRLARGQTIAQPVRTTAIVPTVADLMGFEIVDGTYASTSLLQAGVEPVRVACHVENSCLARIDAGGKYIHHFGRRPDEYFNLADDPLELDNRIDQIDPAQIASWRRELIDWRTAVQLRYR